MMPIGVGSIPCSSRLITVLPDTAMRLTPSQPSSPSRTLMSATAAACSSRTPSAVPAWLIRVTTLSPNRFWLLKQPERATTSPFRIFTAATVVVPRSMPITVSARTGSGDALHSTALFASPRASESSGTSTSPVSPASVVRHALTAIGSPAISTAFPLTSQEPAVSSTRQRPQVPLPPQRKSSGKPAAARREVRRPSPPRRTVTFISRPSGNRPASRRRSRRRCNRRRRFRRRRPASPAHRR